MFTFYLLALNESSEIGMSLISILQMRRLRLGVNLDPVHWH